MDAISEASFQTCTRKPKSPKACKWFDKDTKSALNQMRKDRQRARVYPSPHNILRSQTSNKQYKYQIKRAKRSHAMAYASTVNATTDLWALNKWYRGIRKSIMPALKRKDSSWASDSKSKADLLCKTWFPNMHSSVIIPFTTYPTPRPFLPITDEEIRLAFKNLSNTSAPGISGLGYKVLKWAFEADTNYETDNALKNIFSYLLKRSIELGFHHPRWKTSLVVAIPKPGKKDYIFAFACRTSLAMWIEQMYVYIEARYMSGAGS